MSPCSTRKKTSCNCTGFFKLDAVYQDAGVNGLTIPRYAVAGDGNAYLSATHSRIGFKYVGTPLANGMTVSAVLEMDFLDTTSPNPDEAPFPPGLFQPAEKRPHPAVRPGLGPFFAAGADHADDQRLPLADGQPRLPPRPGALRLFGSAPRFRRIAQRSRLQRRLGGHDCRSCSRGWASSWARTTSSSSASRASTDARTPAARPFLSKTRSTSPAWAWTGTWPSASTCR